MLGFLMVWLIITGVAYIAIPGDVDGIPRFMQAAFYGFVFAVVAALLSQCGFGGGEADVYYRR